MTLRSHTIRLLGLLSVLALTGCATCREHPVSCAVSIVAVGVVTGVALSCNHDCVHYQHAGP